MPITYNEYVNPTIIIQEFDVGANVSGITPNGTKEYDYETKGRILRYRHCTVGGEFIAPDVFGMAMSQILVKLTGATNVNIVIYDTDTGIEFNALDSSLNLELKTDDFVWVFRGMFLPPKWKLKVVATGVLTGIGEIAIWQGRGWELTPFSLVDL